MNEKGKSLWGAAVLNLLLPGLGYLYVGKKRKFLSVGLLVGSIIPRLSPALVTAELYAPAIISSVVLAVVFAVDAYHDARETKQQENRP